MFGKRKRARQAEVQTIEGAVDEILSSIRTWTDPCGVAYSLKHKVEKQQKRYLVHVGRFDELEVAMVMDQLVDRQLIHSDYTVVKVEFELYRRNIIIHIIKSPDPAIRELIIDQHAASRLGRGEASTVNTVGKKRGRESEDDYPQDVPATDQDIGTARNVEVRVSQLVKNVDDDDVDAVRNIIAAIFRITGASTVEVINRPTTYDLCVSYAVSNMVDTRMISDARASVDAVFDARIVYDESCMVITIRKRASNM
jgi:hypothetical protein